MLRDQRIARELAIDDVAARLRIRSRYLEAIEQGRFDQLPGAAYIPAFLRAYANHIGLDADKVMTAYQLSGPVPIARPVTLPADFPLVERRAPIGLAVLTVLLVIAAGYAVWHYLPRQQMIVSEKVPPVPDRLMATPAPAPQPATVPSADKPSPPATQTTQEATTQTAPAPGASTPAAPTSAASAPAPAAAVPAAPASSPAAAAANEVWPAPKQETEAGASAVPPAAMPPSPPPPVMMPAPGIGQAQAAQAPAPAPAPLAQQPAPQEATAPPAAPVATPPMQADTKVFARSNSWIELRGPAGEVLTQTYVRAGESYTVPAGISYRIIDAR
ncbi:MAG: helix-turn-helix domain-containing protein [Proteobacteria bacterium]|nr:helix-turn-helix domain-containing protein [Pseudomonadota bacterium]